MVKACSNDLRWRVVRDVEAGSTVRAAAARFGVAISSAVKWTNLYRRTGSIDPKACGGRSGSVLDEHGDFIRSRIAAQAHVTVRGLRRELEERGVMVSHNAVWLWLRREVLTHKKTATGHRAAPS